MITIGMNEVSLGGIGRLACLSWADENLGHRQKGSNGQNLVGAAVLGALDQHFTKLRIERECRHDLTHRCQLTIVVESFEVVEQLERTHKGLRRRGIHKIKVDKIINAKFLELQHDRTEVAAQNFGVCLLNEFLDERVLGIEAERLARTRTTGTTGALLCTGLGDWRHEQRLDTNARVVDLLLRKTGIDHVDDTVDGQRGFGNVCRNDDLAARRAIRGAGLGCRVEDPLLGGGGQGRVERHDLDRTTVNLANLLVDLGLDLATRGLNLFFTRQKDEDITFGLAQMDLDDGADGGLEIVALRLGCIINLDRESTARNTLSFKMSEIQDPIYHSLVHSYQQRRVIEVFLELASIEGGRHDHNLQVLALAADLLEQTHQNIGVERTFVSLIEHDGRVAVQERVGHGLTQKHTVGHVLEERFVACVVLETDAVTDLFAELNVHLIRHTLGHGHGSHTTRLSTGNHLSFEMRQLVIRQELGDSVGRSVFPPPLLQATSNKQQATINTTLTESFFRSRSHPQGQQTGCCGPCQGSRFAGDEQAAFGGLPGSFGSEA